jgi:hypothetical protein
VLPHVPRESGLYGRGYDDVDTLATFEHLKELLRVVGVASSTVLASLNALTAVDALFGVNFSDKLVVGVGFKYGTIRNLNRTYLNALVAADALVAIYGDDVFDIVIYFHNKKSFQVSLALFFWLVVKLSHGAEEVYLSVREYR